MTLPFTHALSPKFYDFDMGGVAHNVVYVRWLEDARLAFLAASGWPIERLQQLGVLPAVTRTEIDYKRPVRPGDALSARVTVTKAGRSSWGLSITLFNPQTDAVFAEARQSGCFVTVQTMRPAAMPAEFAAFLRGGMRSN